VSGEEAWVDTNQRALSAELERVKATLSRHADGADPADAAAPPAVQGGSALDRICALFRLTPFERDVVLLAAGIELDGAMRSVCARAQGDGGRAHATFGLALATLPEPHWSALSPAAPLRYWRLVEVDAADSLTATPLRIHERILHYLAGVEHLDSSLEGLVEPVEETLPLAPSQARAAERIASYLASSPPAARIALCGEPSAPAHEIAEVAVRSIGRRLFAVRADSVPTLHSEHEALARTWDREAALMGAALLVDCRRFHDLEPARTAAVESFVDRVGGIVIAASRAPLPGLEQRGLRVDVAKPTEREQRTLWNEALGEEAARLDGRLDVLVGQFDVGAETIAIAASDALAGETGGRTLEGEFFGRLWDTCRSQARPALEDLADRIEPAADWAELVLPEPQRVTLGQLAAHVRRRLTVNEHWGFAAKSSRGLGITALFSGPSGTGKTMAAEVLANELRLDLYRIDLSSVVSKYIGETEKNLRRVFEAAEGSGAILLFDEADALFGKRTEVKDSHDRYANIEVSYLLQRMEAYRGLAILTTNLEGALDQAFMRRIRFVVRFPFPNRDQRREIWRRIFPAATPRDGLDVEKLARLDVTGGSIYNIGLNAAFLAADESEPVRMVHLAEAARGEYGKLEQPLPELELAEWR
jgi:hypothetical protein